MNDTSGKVMRDKPISGDKKTRKGVPNKCSFQAKQIAEEMGVDPFRVLLMIVSDDWEGLGYSSPTYLKYDKSGESSWEEDRITLDHRLTAAKEATKYLHQQLKAVEHSGGIENRVVSLEEFIKQQNKE